MKSWPFIVATIILLGTLGFMDSLSHGEPSLPKENFSNFPLTLANRWEGRDLDMPEKVLDVLKVSDYLMRYYEPKSPDDTALAHKTLAPLSLYVGYYHSQRSGATYHSPKNCLPGAGWNFVESGTVSIPLNPGYKYGENIRINKVLIQKGLEQQLVLYWYHDRGRIIASEYMAKVYMVWDAMTQNRTDGALVRIIVPVHTTTDDAFQAGITFLNDMWPDLIHFMPQAIST